MARKEKGPGVVELPIEDTEEYKTASNVVGRIRREIVAANKRYDQASNQFQQLIRAGVKTKAQKTEHDRLEREISSLRQRISQLNQEYTEASRVLRGLVGR